MSKKIIAMLTALVMILGCTGALAENTKHERVYVVAGADGSVKSITDSIRLENTDGLDELTDRTMLTDILNVGGNETFTLEGETLVWKANGKNVIYQGASAKAPAVVPVVTLTLDGEEISAADLKEKAGEAVLTVTYRTEGQAPALVLSALLLPEEGISDLKTENAAVLTEAERSVLVGWAVPNMDPSLQLPVSFSAVFHADHADLGWMMTFCSSDPLEAACRELDARIDGMDPEALLKDVTALLTALKDGADLPETEGMTKEIVGKINELNKGLKDLDASALQLAEGAQQVAEGSAALDTGLAALKGNNDTLNNGAEQLFAAILNTANDQIAASGLADAGITIPVLTAENYAEILDGVIAQLDPDTLKAAASAKIAEEVRKQVAAKEDQIRAGVLEAVKGKVLEAVLKAAGFEMTAEQYAAALKGGLVSKEQAAQVDTAVEAQMKSEAILAQTEAAVQEQIEKLVTENTEAYLAKDETITAKLAQAAAAREQLLALKEKLDQVNTFVTGLKDYTDGVAQASDGAATLSAGAMLVSAGASTLQETGTKVLKDSILTAEKSAAEKLLPLMEKDLAGALNAWKTTKDQLTDTGYDLKPEGMDEETVYIIRTDLK